MENTGENIGKRAGIEGKRPDFNPFFAFFKEIFSFTFRDLA
jgi:hypothetical protein